MTLNELQKYAENLWDSYSETFPALVRFDCPRIEINNRFRTCGARCHVMENVIQISGKHLAKFKHPFLLDVLPHELAHQIDYNLNGWPQNNRWHGKNWCTIMVKLGQAPDTYLSDRFIL